MALLTSGWTSRPPWTLVCHMNNSIAGLTLPHLSAPDPEVAGEGSLDPLGLAAIADRLAEEIAPDVRARMHRIRFVAAIAVGAAACESLTDVLPADGVSTPALCFEWLLIEAADRTVPYAGRLTSGPEKDGDEVAQRRLLYVGMTRATDHLFMTVSGNGRIGADLLAAAG